MAHYAFLNENNVVTNVIVGVDETELIDGLNPETWYSNFTRQVCKRTSYNAHLNGFRKNYAEIGGTYDTNFDAFISPRPFLSWKLNYTTFQWEAPTPMPTLTENYKAFWSEFNKEWIQVER